MSQIKIYGHLDHLNLVKVRLSDVIHACVVEALQLPADKRFHRFFSLAAEDFVHPVDRSEKYTILEITMMEGRTVVTKKKLIKLLFERIQQEIGIQPHDLEISIHESPAYNWGFRGMCGDEVKLNYKIKI